jgi:hypothetical protein
MEFETTISNILLESSILSTSKTKPIVNAIKNKNKISFMYNGPRKPEKIRVLPGKRINAEPVAIGLSKKGNLVVRAWVGPPSVSKKGFAKTNWRTFMVSRMYNVQISTDTFDPKPGYKQGNDRSMSVTYVSTDKSKKPTVKKPTIKKPEPPKPSAPSKTQKELPQPKPQTTVKPQKPVAPQKTKEPKQELPQPKQKEKPTKTVTTKKVETQKQELPKPKPISKPSKNPEDDEMEPLIGLSEEIKRIKSLILY